MAVNPFTGQRPFRPPSFGSDLGPFGQLPCGGEQQIGVWRARPKSRTLIIPPECRPKFSIVQQKRVTTTVERKDEKTTTVEESSTQAMNASDSALIGFLADGALCSSGSGIEEESAAVEEPLEPLDIAAALSLTYMRPRSKQEAKPPPKFGKLMRENNFGMASRRVLRDRRTAAFGGATRALSQGDNGSTGEAQPETSMDDGHWDDGFQAMDQVASGTVASTSADAWKGGGPVAR